MHGDKSRSESRSVNARCSGWRKQARAIPPPDDFVCTRDRPTSRACVRAHQCVKTFRRAYAPPPPNAPAPAPIPTTSPAPIPVRPIVHVQIRDHTPVPASECGRVRRGPTTGRQGAIITNRVMIAPCQSGDRGKEHERQHARRRSARSACLVADKGKLFVVRFNVRCAALNETR